MKKILIFLLLFTIICTGCTAEIEETEIPSGILEDEKVDTTKDTTEEDEKRAIMELINYSISESVDGYDCDVSAFEIDGNIDVSLSMTVAAHIGHSFSDCVYSVTKSTRKALDYYDYPLGRISVTFNIETLNGGSEIINWRSSNYDDGFLFDSTEDYIKEISLEELFEKYDYEPIEEVGENNGQKKEI